LGAALPGFVFTLKNQTNKKTKTGCADCAKAYKKRDRKTGRRDGAGKGKKDRENAAKHL
jgi:hypothetical protein